MACFLSEPCGYEKKRHKLYQEESSLSASKPNNRIRVPELLATMKAMQSTQDSPLVA